MDKIRILLDNRDPIIENIAYLMGSDLHEEWRKICLDENKKHKQRICETGDNRFGTNEIDIVNIPFENLPSNWKYENLEAARVVVGLVYEKIVKFENITSEDIEYFSSEVHKERLKRNERSKNSELDKPYKDLPELEKKKDRNQVLQAISKVSEMITKIDFKNL